MNLIEVLTTTWHKELVDSWRAGPKAWAPVYDTMLTSFDAVVDKIAADDPEGRARRAVELDVAVEMLMATGVDRARLARVAERLDAAATAERRRRRRPEHDENQADDEDDDLPQMPVALEALQAVALGWPDGAAEGDIRQWQHGPLMLAGHVVARIAKRALPTIDIWTRSAVTERLPALWPSDWGPATAWWLAAGGCRCGLHHKCPTTRAGQEEREYMGVLGAEETGYTEVRPACLNACCHPDHDLTGWDPAARRQPSTLRAWLEGYTLGRMARGGRPRSADFRNGALYGGLSIQLDEDDPDHTDAACRGGGLRDETDVWIVRVLARRCSVCSHVRRFHETRCPCGMFDSVVVAQTNQVVIGSKGLGATAGQDRTAKDGDDAPPEKQISEHHAVFATDICYRPDPGPWYACQNHWEDDQGKRVACGTLWPFNDQLCPAPRPSTVGDARKKPCKGQLSSRKTEAVWTPIGGRLADFEGVAASAATVDPTDSFGSPCDLIVDGDYRFYLTCIGAYDDARDWPGELPEAAGSAADALPDAGARVDRAHDQARDWLTSIATAAGAADALADVDARVELALRAATVESMIRAHRTGVCGCQG